MDIAAANTLFAQLSIDWVIVVALVGLLGFDGYQSGAARASAFGIAALIAASVTPLLSHAWLIGGIIDDLSVPHLSAILFMLMTAALYVFVRRMTEAFGFGMGGILSALITGIGATSIVLALWIGTPALASVWHFTALQPFFGEALRFYWIMIGIALLALARG